MRTEMRLTGSGGQGLILAGIIFAEAALLDGNNSLQSQSYGPEARGGASKAEVIISKEEIDFPKVQIPNVLLSLTQVACDKYSAEIADDGIMIIDETVTVEDVKESVTLYRVPILKTASEVIGKSIVANIIAIGFITEMTGLVSKKNVETAVFSRIPKGTEDLNKRALEQGYQLAAALK